MSEDAPKARGRAALDQELTTYGQRHLAHRLCDTMLRAIPGSPELPAWDTLDRAIAEAGVAASVGDRARALADAPEVDQALFCARSIDTGDTGLTILTGVRTALSLFLGDKGPGAGAAAQQRTDAALKALALAYLATRLIPRDPARRVELLQALPTGRVLILYFAAVEVALPFGAAAHGGRFVADLVEQQSRQIAGKLLAVIGREGVVEAQATLAALTAVLDRAVVDVSPHAGGLADAVKKVLPSAIGARAGAMTDVVAAGADALPVYRLLTARFAAETRVALATWEADPASEPVATPAAAAPVEASPAVATPEVSPQPAAAPPPVPAFLVGATLGAEQLRDAAPTPEAPEAATTPPGEHDLSGVYLRFTAVGPEWLVFTREGVVSDRPPARPQPDWLAHAESGARVGTYQHRGDQLEIRWPSQAAARSGAVVTATFSREPTALVLDGARLARCDWNLRDHTLAGTWRARDTDGWWRLDATGGFEGSAGRGRYELGVGAILWRFDGGAERVDSLYSTLEPDSGAPDALWIGAAPHLRADRAAS